MGAANHFTNQPPQPQPNPYQSPTPQPNGDEFMNATQKLRDWLRAQQASQ